MSVNRFINGALQRIAGAVGDAVPVINNLLTNVAGSALDAMQGKILNDKITALSNVSNIKTYTSYEQLGFTSAPTTVELYNAMPVNSIFLGMAIHVSDYPNSSVLIEILKVSDVRGHVKAYGKQTGEWEMFLKDTSGLTGTWVNKLEFNKIISLPGINIKISRSGNVVQVDIDTTADGHDVFEKDVWYDLFTLPFTPVTYMYRVLPISDYSGGLMVYQLQTDGLVRIRPQEEISSGELIRCSFLYICR